MPVAMLTEIVIAITFLVGVATWCWLVREDLFCIGIQYEASDCERRHNGLGIEESL